MGSNYENQPPLTMPATNLSHQHQSKSEPHLLSPPTSNVMARKLKGSKAIKTKALSRANVSKAVFTCPVCEEKIVDVTESSPGQDSVFCVGKCNTWLHRQCVALSVTCFKQLDKSYLCPNCKLDKQQSEIINLNSEITALKSVLSSLEDKIMSLSPVDQATANNAPSNHVQRSYADTLKSTIASVSKELTSANNQSERKFNVVLYGVDESPEGTRKHVRVTHDHDSVVEVVQTLDSSLDQQSIRDCFRIGKYSKEKSRPILIKLARVQSVTSILSNLKKLSEDPKHRKISIKRDMSKQERQNERLLLKERYQLIEAGTSRKDLRIRGNKLLVKNEVYGSVVENKFVRASSLSSDALHSVTDHQALYSSNTPSVSTSLSPSQPLVTSHTSHNASSSLLASSS